MSLVLCEGDYTEMTDWYLRFYATGSAGNRTLVTSVVAGVDSVFTEDLVALYGGSGYTLAQCNTEAKRLVPNWNKTRYWQVLGDTSSDLGTPTHACLYIRRTTHEFDKFMPANGKMNNKLVSKMTGERLNFYQMRHLNIIPTHINRFNESKWQYGRRP